MNSAKTFDEAAFEHIQNSSADPEVLAKHYGITRELVNWIQMGRINFVGACRSKALTAHLNLGKNYSPSR